MNSMFRVFPHNSLDGDNPLGFNENFVDVPALAITLPPAFDERTDRVRMARRHRAAALRAVFALLLTHCAFFLSHEIYLVCWWMRYFRTVPGRVSLPSTCNSLPYKGLRSVRVSISVFGSHTQGWGCPLCQRIYRKLAAVR